MGYVGNQQSEGFVQRPTKQDLTGATGTSLTLSHAVSKEEDIDLYINNVKQEPTTAYTVAGTAVTLTGSVVASDDIYVVYNSLALQTVTPPDGSVTSAKLDTNISVTGDLTVDTSTLHVDSTNNRVGVNTTSPEHGFHVYSDTMKVGKGDDTTDARIIFESDSAKGDAWVGIPTWADDHLYLYAPNGAGANEAVMDYDGTNEITRFYTGGSERMRIDSVGNVGIGTTSGNARLYVEADASLVDPVTVSNTNTTANSQYAIVFVRNGVVRGSIQTTNTATSYNTSSDYRLKENVTDITGATERLKQLNPVRFNFIADADTTVDGFLAHEVQDVVPEAITGTKDAVDDDGNPEYQGIDQSKLVPLLVKTIQELEARIAALESA